MIELIRRHKNFLFFAFLISFFSGYGQTYLLSLFNSQIQDRIGVSHFRLSQIYGLATLAASCFIPFLGRLIDTIKISKITIILSLVLGVAFILFGQAQTSLQVFLLFVVIRLIGQSVLPLVGTTQIAKCFGMYRGKVLSITSIGRPLVEATLPAVVIFFLAKYGFTEAATFLGLCFFIVLIPASFLLVRNFEAKEFYKENSHALKSSQDEVGLKKVYSDYKIYLLSFSNITLGFVMTGIFFHNSSILQYRDWTLSQWGSSFVFMSLMSFSFNFISGYLVDRLGALQVVRFKYLPVFLGVLFLLLGDSHYHLYLFFALVGMSIGISSNTQAAVVAEIFGGKNLGTIKSIDVMIMVISTSLAPVIFSFFFEKHGYIETMRAVLFFILLTTITLNISISLYKRQSKEVSA